MRTKSKLNIGLVALFGLVGLLFNQPLVGVPRGRVFGLPTIILYLLITWVFVILGLFLIARKESKK